MSRLWMIAYDISDDKLRRQVFQQLKNHGARVQYSVFECRLSWKQMTALRERLLDIIEADDSIRWYPLCQWCEDEIRWQGSGKAVDDDRYYLV